MFNQKSRHSFLGNPSAFTSREALAVASQTSAAGSLIEFMRRASTDRPKGEKRIENDLVRMIQFCLKATEKLV